MDTSTEDGRRFVRPPQQFTDATERTVAIEAYTGGPGPLVAMYEAFDDDSRSQGVPPRGETQRREWVETLLEEGLNVVVRHDGAVVGHAVLMPADGTAELAIFVHPAYQSAGIGTRLIEVLLGHGQVHGVDHVWLSVAQTNRIAMQLYHGVGFETRLIDRAEQEMQRSL